MATPRRKAATTAKKRTVVPAAKRKAKAAATKKKTEATAAKKKAAAAAAKARAEGAAAKKQAAAVAKKKAAAAARKKKAAVAAARKKAAADLKEMQATIAELGKRLGDKRLVGTVDKALDLTLERLQEAVAFAKGTAEEAREGFDDFDVSAFRKRLRSLFTDLRRAGAQARRILVQTDPNDPLFRGKAINRLIGQTPPVMLYSVSRALEPLDDDFWDLASDVAKQLTKLPSIQDTLDEKKSEMCDALLKVPEVEIVLKIQLRRLGFAAMYLKFVKANLPNDLMGAGVAVGGAGVTLTKYPPTWIIDVMLKVMEFEEKALQRILEVWADCRKLKAEEEAQEAQEKAQEQIDRIEQKLDRLLAAGL